MQLPIKTNPALSAAVVAARTEMEAVDFTCNLTEQQANYTSLVDPGYCTLPDWVVILEIVFLAIVAVGTILLNSYVLFLVCKFKFLRYRSIIVCLSVVVSDLLLGFTYLLPAMINASARDWVFGGVLGCTIIGYIVFYLLGVRWMVMGLIALDRFFYIVFPLSYIRWSKPFNIVLTILAWIVPLSFHALAFSGREGFDFRAGFSHCAVNCKDDRVCSNVVTVIFALQLVVGAIVPIILYTIMYIYSRVKKREIQLGTQIGEETDRKGRRSIISIPATWSSRDLNALFTFLLVFIVFLIANIPVYFVSILRPINTEIYSQIPLWAHFIITDLFYILGVLDPIIIMRNRDFRKASEKLFCRSRFRRRQSSVHAVSSSESNA